MRGMIPAGFAAGNDRQNLPQNFQYTNALINLKLKLPFFRNPGGWNCHVTFIAMSGIVIIFPQPSPLCRGAEPLGDVDTLGDPNFLVFRTCVLQPIPQAAAFATVSLL
jgi:hypothetical protein